MRADEFYELLMEETDACVTWEHARGKNGYGQVPWHGRVEYVHVIACEYLHGPRPDHGSRVETRHTCHNRACFNPRHLTWGTVAENQADRLRDGTHQHGERCHFAKLTRQQVEEVRRRLGAGDRQVDIARDVGVSPVTIRRIRDGRTWVLGL